MTMNYALDLSVMLNPQKSYNNNSYETENLRALLLMQLLTINNDPNSDPYSQFRLLFRSNSFGISTLCDPFTPGRTNNPRFSILVEFTCSPHGFRTRSVLIECLEDPTTSVFIVIWAVASSVSLVDDSQETIP